MRLLCLMFAGLASVAILEVGVRILSREGESLLTKDAAIGQRYLAGFDGVRYVPEAGRSVRLRFNSQGFRGPEWDSPRQADRGRIVVLGDSFVAAIGVDESETMTALLGANLATSPGVHVETINLGVSGFGTAQELLTWRSVGRTLAPDVVALCFYNGNDLSDNCERMSTANRPYFTLDESHELLLHPMSMERVAASSWLTRYSQLYVWQKNRMRILRDRWRTASGRLPPGFEIFRMNPPEPFAEAWRVTEALLAALQKETAEAGAALVLIQIPCHEQLFEKDWTKLLATVGKEAASYQRDHPERRIAEICRRHGIPRHSLLPALETAARGEQLFFDGNGHWNARGNAVAASEIAQALRRLLPTRLASKR